MNYRRFGRTGWNVSEIGYGMWGMGGWTGSDDAESLDSLQRAVDLGCNFFDTAWAYGEGHSEQLLGKVLRANKNNAAVGGPDKKLYVATKVPPKNRRWPARPEYSLDDSYPPDYIFEYVDKSLKNIGVDTLDLIQLHTWEDGWLKDERVFRAVEKLKTTGKVRAFGLSLNRWEPANGVRAVRAGLVDAVQVIYNIFDQNPEDALFPICRMKNVAVIARVPFDEGTLTGTLTVDSKWPQGDWRNTYFVPENLKNSVAHAEALRPLAGNWAYALFTLGIIGTGMLSVPILAGSCAYAIAEAAAWRGSLDDRPKDARGFYAVVAVAMGIGLLLDFAGFDAVAMLFWSAVVNGVLAPPLIVLVVLLTSDAAVMGERRNPLWLRTLGWASAAVMTVAAVAMFVTATL